MATSARLQRAGALTPRDRIWAAIRGFGVGGLFTPAEAVFLCNLKGRRQLDPVRPDTAMSYVRALAAAGYIAADSERRPLARPRAELSRYCLVRDTGVDAPRLDASGKPCTKGAGRSQMWLFARKAKGPFDWRAMLPSLALPVSQSEAQWYLGFLARAGYLKRTEKGGRGHVQQYVFVRSRDTGPRPPLVDARKRVVDGNTGAVMLEGPHAR